MNKQLLRLLGVVLTLGLLAAACGDDTTETAAPEESDMSDIDDMSEMDDMDGHSHDGVLEVPEGMEVPEISVELSEDPKAGYNLAVSLDNFTVAPEAASTDAVDGQGHLHLYINGERQMRFYNEWLHLNLPEGDHTIEVEVSANNHSAYAVDGEPIRASADVSVGAPAEHSHGGDMTFDVDAADAPAISVTVVEDPKSGWNLHAPVKNFTLAPESASTDPVVGEGHMHLYIDGEKITRLYGEWWHIAELTEGDHEIMVEVSANNHAPYSVDGQPITAMATVTVTADQATSSDHDHGDDMDHDDAADHDHSDSTEMESGDAADADVVIEAALVDGAVQVEDDRIAVDLGQTVALVVSSDATEEVHVHGYDLYGTLTEGETTTLVFEASIPGVFEIELEQSGTLITELEVS